MHLDLIPLQLSCSSSSPILKNRVRFRRYFQLLPTGLDLVPGFFGTMQYYGWKQVVIVQQEENLFSQVSYYMVSLLLHVLSFVHDCNDIAYVSTSLSASNCPLQPPPDVYVFDCKHQESDTVLFYSYIKTLSSAALIKHVATIRPYAFVTISHIH